MRMVCAGGGPAGLYFAISAKLRNPAHDVTVVERRPAGVTYGWGVVYWDDLLDTLYRNDPVSAREIHGSSVVWDGQRVHVADRRPACVGGYGHGVGRWRFLDVLTRRAEQLGVHLQFEQEIADVPEVADADLVIAADGVNSRLRWESAEHLEPELSTSRAMYVWLGTHKVFRAFTFAFERTDAGWLWFHAYAYDDDTSTFIVECLPETWKGLGFDSLDSDQSLALLEQIFARHLDGHALFAQSRESEPHTEAERAGGPMPWLNFVQVRNRQWSHGNLVLAGDAAHTTHFSIGSGTRLAVEDAITLADRLHEADLRDAELATALAAYGAERRAAVAGWQQEANRSAQWFEDAELLLEREHPVRFGYLLATRRNEPGMRLAVPSFGDWRYLVYLTNQVSGLRRLRRHMVTTPRMCRRARQRARQAGAVGTRG